MNFTLRQLEAFTCLVRLQSFRKTAESLYTTQPAISARIASLEKALGARLFHRSALSVSLTEQGQKLLVHAEEVLRSAERLQQYSGNRASVSGTIRLGISETIVHTLLPRFLSGLNQRYPEIDVEVTVDVTVNLGDALQDGTIDLAFLMGPIPEPTINNFDLATFPLVWVASPKLATDIGKEPLNLVQLASYPILTYARNTRPFVEIFSQLQEHASDRVRIFPSSSLAATLRMAVDAIGIASLPATLVAQHITEGSLQEIDCQWQPSALHFTASFSCAHTSPVVALIAGLARDLSKS